jgi:para-aminobenzoate synthetase component I
VKNIKTFRKQLLHWGAQFEVSCYFDNNGYSDCFTGSDFEVKFAAGVKTELLTTENKNAFDLLQEYTNIANNWLFGFLTYELKDQTENLTSGNMDHLLLPQIYFFQPNIIITIEIHHKIIIEVSDDIPYTTDHIFNSILGFYEEIEPEYREIPVSSRVSREDYIQQVQKIKKHIARGDIYEMNYCIEFFATADINPYDEFLKLMDISPTPYSAFFRCRDKYLICASPERFLKKKKSVIISQPIKGTYPRGSTIEEDEQLKYRLKQDLKERSENIMIVDLVRNDLSRIANRKSVKVEELCGIYTFPQVHQMISTISAGVNNKCISEILKHTFPMGSMTGAPKIEAMKLIEKYENTRRGLYSGAVGYITPEKGFDFNVVIRSIIYNAGSHYLSFMVGSAITSFSDPEKEYEECLLKASAIQKILNKQPQHA